MDTTFAVRQSAREFAKQHIAPYYREWDDKELFPKDLFHKMGEMGFMGVFIPEKYGGSGFGYNEYLAVLDEISQVDPSIGLSVAAHNSLCTNHIYMFGNEKQKNTYLPQLASGQHIGAWGLTEPSTGSDALRMETTAVKKGDKWVINGMKNFITHGKSCDVMVVTARTGDKGDSHGISAFIVEQGTPGFSHGQVERKLGMKASETAQVLFQDCEIPEENRIGEIGEGFIQAMKVLDGGRISIGALSLGLAKGAYGHALQYSKEREQFGKPISSFQAIAFKLADMATHIEASELLLKEAIRLKEAGENFTKVAAMAKLFASDKCVEIATEAVQIFGGYGFTKDYPVEKYFRDCKLCVIGEGTSEIQKLVISRLIQK